MYVTCNQYIIMPILLEPEIFFKNGITFVTFSDKGIVREMFNPFCSCL